MVPADSRKIPRVPRYSGYHYASFSFEYRTITVYGPIFQRVLLTKFLATSWSYNPNIAVTTLVWANPRSLATTRGIINLFSLPTGTKMFQFPALASCYARCHSFRMTGCPIRKSSDQRLFAPARSLSQLITSFIASESQGIRHAPLLTFFQTFYSRTGIGSRIASFYQYCVLEHVRFDIYF